MRKLSVGVLKSLYAPAPHSHKGDNGSLVVVGGSERYHGAPLLAVKTASRFVDFVLFYSPARINERVMAVMKSKTNCFIWIKRSELLNAIEESDCVLIGNGLLVNAENKRLVNGLLKRFAKRKKMVLDAGALRMADKRLFTKNVLVSPHPLEFEALFGVTASVKEARKQARKWNCLVLLKKKHCFITDGNEVWFNNNGNAGMTKGGTGDVLAGVCASLACKNNLLEAAKTAAFVNGRAGDSLRKRKGFVFNADDLAEEVGLIV
ncbi:MAG: NAD(P)H-hydrate dehydratase [Candidatus Micrarchaeota archaeon]